MSGTEADIKNVWILVDSMPMFLIMQVNLNDIYSIWYVVAVIAVGGVGSVSDQRNIAL